MPTHFRFDISSYLFFSYISNPSSSVDFNLLFDGKIEIQPCYLAGEQNTNNHTK